MEAQATKLTNDQNENRKNKQHAQRHKWRALIQQSPDVSDSP